MHALTWLELDWRPQTAFAAPVLGCTLFSRWLAEAALLCADEQVARWLDGYLTGRPFAVVGDPRPLGFVPRPALAPHEFIVEAGTDPKSLKTRRWVPVDALVRPVEHWLACAKSDAELLRASGRGGAALLLQGARSSFDESTGDAVKRSVIHHAAVPWVLDVLLDTSRLPVSLFLDVLARIGAAGVGAHAARGLGKFSLGEVRPGALPAGSGSSVYCLGAVSPPPVSRSQGYDFARYRVRILRGWSVSVRGRAPIEHAKAPVLLAEAGAVFDAGGGPVDGVFGRGLGGKGSLSRVDGRAIAQGYAPALNVLREATVSKAGAPRTAPAGTLQAPT